jgi:hypothetical protein
MKIIIEIKTVYGNTLYYPVCAKAMLFARLGGGKTLKWEALEIIKQLGYEVEVQAPVL